MGNRKKRCGRGASEHTTVGALHVAKRRSPSVGGRRLQKRAPWLRALALRDSVSCRAHDLSWRQSVAQSPRMLAVQEQKYKRKKYHVYCSEEEVPSKEVKTNEEDVRIKPERPELSERRRSDSVKEQCYVKHSQRQPCNQRAELPQRAQQIFHHCARTCPDKHSPEAAVKKQSWPSEAR